MEVVTLPTYAGKQTPNVLKRYSKSVQLVARKKKMKLSAFSAGRAPRVVYGSHDTDCHSLIQSNFPINIYHFFPSSES